VNDEHAANFSSFEEGRRDVAREQEELRRAVQRGDRCDKPGCSMPVTYFDGPRGHRRKLCRLHGKDEKNNRGAEQNKKNRAAMRRR
jgi:hypothetical protein